MGPRYNDTLQELDLGANRVGDEASRAVTRALPYLRLQTFRGVVVGDDFQLLAEELAQRDCHVTYRIPPSSRERSRDLPLEMSSRDELSGRRGDGPLGAVPRP
ncbi:hypothetical protein RRG08_035509 [Elysia crispata]|uniref:Uncharacterized protein n=1 Tax=Elysia crispata TaxID=231223 RepID=A0AAE1A5Y5_9GAST|nr:hypothetical protein RRG08_035509 [Elysia crispata]